MVGPAVVTRALTGVVFDLDGTLYRLRYDVDELRRTWSRRCGIATGPVAAMLDAMTETDRRTALAELTDAECAGVRAGEPVAGAAEVLARVRRLLPIAVVSRNSRQAVVAALASLGHDDVTVVARGEAAAEKPAGAPVLAACASIASDPVCTLVIGDTSHDVAAAAAAGARSVVVRNADVPVPPQGGDRYVASLSDVPRVVEELLS